MSTARPAADVAERFREFAFRRLPLACLAGLAAAGVALGPGWSGRLAALPWLVSLLAVGLPHGAADFAVSRRAWRGWPLAGLWLAYAAVMAAVAAGFAAAPAAAIAVFAVLSCWHFGEAHAVDDAPADAWPARAVAAVARGGVVLACPLAVWPAETARAASDLAALAAGRGGTAATLLSPESVRWAGLGLAGATAAAVGLEGLLVGPRAGGLRRWGALLVDIGVIAALGAFTDPLFSVGAYFLAWHGWRQMDRLAEEVTGAAPRSWPELWRAVARVHAAALPLLVPTWAALGTAWWLWSPARDPRDLAILSIGAYLVVTPAHELLGDLVRAVAGGRAEVRPGYSRRRLPCGTVSCRDGIR